MSARLPEAWLNSVRVSCDSAKLRVDSALKKKATRLGLLQYLHPDFVQFLRSAKGSSPCLFSDKVKATESGNLLGDLHNVFLAYNRLHKLRESGSWSEADWAAQV